MKHAIGRFSKRSIMSAKFGRLDMDGQTSMWGRNLQLAPI